MQTTTSGISQKDRDFLKTRGYQDPQIDAEGWFSLPDGRFKGEGLDFNFRDPYLATWCTTPTGIKTALHLVSMREKAYRRLRTEKGQYLPIYYTSEEDFQLLEQKREVILVEGVFDRIALKQVCSFATLALLGLGFPGKLGHFLQCNVDRVWLMLDRDERGAKASERIERSLRTLGVWTHTVRYGYKDPGLWREKRGAKMETDLQQEMELNRW